MKAKCKRHKSEIFWSNVFGFNIFSCAFFREMIATDINRCLREIRDRFKFLLLVKRLACKSLMIICLDQFNPIVLSGNISNLHLVLG